MCISVPRLVLYLLNFPAAFYLNAQDTLEPGDHPCQIKAQVEPYRTIREADVMWERRVWRMIDLQEETGKRLSTSQVGCMDLYEVIRHGLLDEGSITAFDPGPDQKDDGFSVPMSRPELELLFEKVETGPGSIARIMIKEDWIFDRQRGEMIVRIIGVAPMVEVLGELDEVRGYEPIFWLYYPECRLLFARWINSEENDGSATSYESYFAQRRFNSTIIKVSNVQDRHINTYRYGLDALLESGSIREQLRNMDFDLWNY